MASRKNVLVTAGVLPCYVDLKFLQSTYESSIFSVCHPLFGDRQLFDLHSFVTGNIDSFTL